MKRFVSLMCLMMSFLFATSQVVTVKFTGATQNGSHCRFDAVNVVNITKGWNETLVYPDTVIVLSCPDALDEFSANQTGIFNVFPNPFTDYTNVEFGIGESSQVEISVYGIDGIRRAYWEGHLSTGVHRVKISLSETQMAFVVVQTEKERYVGKLLHFGHGSKNSIEFEASSLLTKQAHLEHLDAEGDFDLGDVMSYEGVIVNGGNMVLSNKVIQAQYVDETIWLVFPLNLPAVTTTNITDITQTTATGGGDVTDNGGLTIVERGICWSTSHNPNTSDSHISNGTSMGSFICNMTGLTAGTIYYVRAYATNNVGTAYGSEVSFTTLQNVTLPTVTTTAVMDITQTTATGSGNVTNDGESIVTDRGVCWSTSHNPTINNSHTADGTGTGSFTSSMTGLTANTTYYVRAYATNSAGTAYGSEVSFTTLQNVTLPTVTTATITDITQTTATGGGAVTDDGGGTVSARGVCWSTSHNPTISGNHTVDGTGTGSFISSLTGLTANTTYYVRAYATNSAGTAYGSEVSFTTLQNVTLPMVTTTTVTNITQTTATGGGAVTGDGGGMVTERGVCWSTSHDPAISGSHTVEGTGTGGFSSNITGLTANTTYYVRAYATNGVGTAYGSEVSFTTLQNVTLPTVTTASITNITQTTATGGGAVTGDGGGMVTGRGVCWSTSHDPTISGSHTTDGTGTGSFSSSITGLTANTIYYVRAYATNSAGTAYGSEESFTTLQNVTLPTVTTTSITNITQTTATGGGNVTDAGGSTVTGRGVCWSTWHDPTINDSHTIDGTSTGSFSSSITGLTANTTYYVRAYATNSAGTAYGSEVSFTTLQVPSYTISVSANPSDGGTITGGGNYQQGQNCTVSATANLGYTFLNWTENGNSVSTNANYTFSVSSNRTLVANFTYDGGVPIGAIDGLFSVSATKQVYFSQGNLQYIGSASSPYWKFAENQWECIGTTGQYSANQNVDRDLFGWGTSGHHIHSSQVCYQPWSTSQTSSDYGTFQFNITVGNLGDWGTNRIVNGGNQRDQWRTLTSEEWDYVITTRSTSSGVRYARAQVNDVNGTVLLPDDWSTSIYSLNDTNTPNASYESNIMDVSQWSILEQNGAVFLPAAGHRNGTSVTHVNTRGRYWSASHYGPSSAYCFEFNTNNQGTQSGYGRYSGFSVRLVQDVE